MKQICQDFKERWPMKTKPRPDESRRGGQNTDVSDTIR